MPATQIKTLVEPDIDEGFDKAIRDLQVRCFPHCELFRTSRFYVHKPRQGDLRVVAMADGRLAAHVAVYQAEAETDGGKLELACIGNVCSDPDMRGSGAAAACIDAALEHSRWADRQWAMLFCRDNVADYYRRWAFARIDNEIYVTAPDSEPRKYPKDDFAMVAPLTGQKPSCWPHGKIVLDVDIF